MLINFYFSAEKQQMKEFQNLDLKLNHNDFYNN